MDIEKTGMKSGVKTACGAGWQDENRCDGMVVFIVVMWWGGCQVEDWHAGSSGGDQVGGRELGGVGHYWGEEGGKKRNPEISGRVPGVSGGFPESGQASQAD
jgi:hypothetical protein